MFKKGTWVEHDDLAQIFANASVSDTAVYGFECSLIVQRTWGNSYNPAAGSGVQIEIHDEQIAGGTPTPSHYITFTWPSAWGGGGTYTDGPYGTFVDNPNYLQARFKWNDLVFTFDDSCNFSGSFSSIDCQVSTTENQESPSWTTVHTIAGNTFSGTGFDKRLNKLRLDSVVGTADPAYLGGAPACGSSIPSGNFSYDIENDWRMGWRRSADGVTFETDTIAFLPITVPSITCSCSQGISGISASDSYHITGIKHSFAEFILTDEGTWACPPIVCSPRGEHKVWKIETNWYYDGTNSCDATSTLAGIHDVETLASAACGLGAPTTDGPHDLTESITYSEYSIGVFMGNGYSNCYDGTCFGSIDCVPSFPDTSTGECEYQASLEMTWPNFPPCADAVKDLDCEHHHQLAQYFAAYIDNDNNVHVITNHFYIPVTGHTTDITVTSSGNCASPCITVTTNGMLYLTYTKGSNTVYRISQDQGNTWSGETTLFGSLTNPKYGRSLCYEKDNTMVWVVFDYVSGTSGPGYLWSITLFGGDDPTSLPSPVKIKDKTGAYMQVADTPFDLSPAGNSMGMMNLFVILDGDSAPSHHVTADYGKTFSVVYP